MPDAMDDDPMNSLLGHSITYRIAVALHDGRHAPPIRIRTEMKHDLLASGETRLDHWVSLSGVADFVEVDDLKIHYNANTDEELERYFHG